MVIYRMLQAFLQGAYELFFPDNCLLCRRFLNSLHQRQLCPTCLGCLAFNDKAFGGKEAAFAFDEAWSASRYNEGAQKLLHAFKYNGKTSLYKTFVPLMIDFATRHQMPIQSWDMIIPMALHPVRLRERGYNQSALLSKGLSLYWKIPHEEDLLIRRKMTTTQTELGAKERWTNLEGAFTINHSLNVSGKSVLLVDDLITTGATLHWAADAFKKAGAKRVSVFTFCVA